jgi:hypothetical protein
MTINTQLDPNYCAIAFLGDVSGSMSTFNTKEYAQSITNIIRENSEKFDVVFYGATFSNKFNIFADGVDGSTVEITEEDLNPSGLTSIVPSLARMIKHVGSRLNDMTNRKPGKVIFIMLSDGEQTTNKLSNRIASDLPYEGIHANAKLELKKLVDEHTNVWKWSFMYMGANFDSITAGADYGFSKNSCINFCTSDLGIRNVLNCVNTNIKLAQTNAAKRVQTYNDTGEDVSDDDMDGGFDDQQRNYSMCKTT